MARAGVLVQGLADARDRAGKRLEVLLEVGEDGVCVLLGVVAGVALVLGRLVADGVGLLLREAHDLLVACEDHGLLLGVRDDGARLLLGALERLLLLFEDAAGVRELLREHAADLVKDLVDVLGVHDLLLAAAGQGRLGLGHDLLELVDEALDFLSRLHPGLLSKDAAGATLGCPRASRAFLTDLWYQIKSFFMNPSRSRQT